MQVVKNIKLSDLERQICGAEATIRTVLEKLNSLAESFVVVVNCKRNILGTLTDGDLRRAIMKNNLNLDDLVVDCMKADPIVGHEGKYEENLQKLSELDLPRPFLPVVDGNNSLISILVGNKTEKKFNTALILAGGLGSRLGKKTENTPKPLLEIGGEPIISRIVNRLEVAGFDEIYISVHYLSEKIQHFFEKRKNKASIKLLFEDKPLGTAGSLGLLPSSIDTDILVINGDILTDVNFDNFRDMHLQNGNHATIAAASLNVEIPFGVLQYKTDGEFQSIEEKPTRRYFVCAGLYCLSPLFLRLLPKMQKLDMPDLINMGKSSGLKVGIFPIHEYWKDIGLPDDFYEAEQHFS